MSPPPGLPYAPRRNRPLSLWNPWDYLCLLYWVFFFPQALRWYVETFGKLPAEVNVQQAFREDPLQRRLALQGLFLTIAVTFTVAIGLDWFGVETSLLGVAFGLAGGLAVSMAGGVMGGVAFSVAFGMANSVMFGVAGGLAGGVAGGLAGGVAGSVAAGAAFGVASVALGVALGVAFGAAVGLAGVAGVVLGVAFGVASVRLDLALLALLPTRMQQSKRWAIALQRASPLPIPGLRHDLIHRLNANWATGLKECEGLLRYSLQFIPVVEAIQEVLQQTSDQHLLSRIASWCSQPLYDWQVVLYQSASLHAALRKAFWDEFYILPRRWRPQIVVTPRLDTPARAACAGFWHLHQGTPQEATKAFAVIRHLPQGEELHENAQALAAAADCKTLDSIGNWQAPDLITEDLLRPQVRAALQELATIAREAHLVQHSRSARQRNSALNRASGALNAFPSHLVDCPSPERELLEGIAKQWLQILLNTASAVGTLEVREPVSSPYIVGAVVPSGRLVGREAVFRQIQAAWAKPGQRDSLVIYGQRRIGKTSIARNLLDFCALGEDTALAYLSLQPVDWSRGLNDLCYALAFGLWRAAPQALEEPRMEDYEHYPLAVLRRWLAQLEQPNDQRRYLLVLDEYEVLDESLAEEQGSGFVTLLRGLTQQYPWLVMALVGLHNLKERSASFYQAIYAWRPIRVGLLDEDGVASVLQVEEDTFPLEYSPAAIARVYTLTGGQPFLVQLLGDALVQRFNQRLRQDLEAPSPAFSPDDVDAVVADPQFYEQGTVYFHGIWMQASEAPSGQQTLLRLLAPHRKGLEESRLQHESHLDATSFQTALQALEDHDVVTRSHGLCRYSVELMRRWVEAGRMGEHPAPLSITRF